MIFFDYEKIKQYFHGDLDVMNDVIEFYLKSSSQLISEMTFAIEKKDANRLRLSVHKLRGNIANFFVAPLEEELLKIELMAKDKSLEQAANLFFGVKKNLESLDQELHQVHKQKAA